MRQLRELEFHLGRRLKVILQTEAAECGLACLGMVAGYHGFDIDLPCLRRRYQASQHGSSLRTLLAWARGLDLSGRPLRLELESLGELRRPALLHWDLNHFVVLERVTRSRVTIVDPAVGRRVLSVEECSKHFSGVALELMPSLDFKPRKERQRLPLSAFWRRATGLKRSLLQLLLATVFLQVFALAMPFYMQLVVDEAIVLAHRSFAIVLALGFAALTLLSAATSWLRSQVLLHLGTALSAQMSTSLFRHLLRLPLSFFERRHMGDIVSRFGSLGPIQDILASRVVSGFVDGLLGLTTLGMMFAYSWQLGLFALGLTVIVTVSANLFLIPIRVRSVEQIAAAARESASFMETVRGIQSIKSVGREVEREAVWHDLLFRRLNQQVGINQLQIRQATLQQVVQSLGQVALVYFAALEVIDGSMTLGMMFAFMSYRSQFASRMEALIDHGREIYLSGLHLERLADIALAQPEEDLEAPDHSPRLSGGLELRNVGYRYSESDPWVLQGIDLCVAPGEMVVITGPSGEGKSTLLKVMMGLLDASQGQVLIDGTPLEQYGRSHFRRQVGAVMQADRLLAGSFTDNICFFDPAPDMERVTRCAQMAGLHDDILKLPMQYNSLVGDMGTVLSAGQQQRLLLARAFYREPQVLFLDEGTANLDQALEERVNDTLASLSATVVIVAHRPDVFAKADRVLRLEHGELSDVTVGRECPSDVRQREPLVVGFI